MHWINLSQDKDSSEMLLVNSPSFITNIFSGWQSGSWLSTIQNAAMDVPWGVPELSALQKIRSSSVTQAHFYLRQMKTLFQYFTAKE